MANEGYHEPVGELSDETRDMHRAITSLMEELEAVDWYNQRVDACKDKELAAILAHNRDEEKEHAAMVLEWIRRRDPKFSDEMKDFLFTDKPIARTLFGPTSDARVHRRSMLRNCCDHNALGHAI
jgi:ferritin-like protein